MAKPINDGGPAFPISAQDGGSPFLLTPHRGMSLRAYIAAKALQGIVSCESTSGTFRDIADEAVAYADALIAALNDKEVANG